MFDFQALKGRQIKRLADRALKGRKLSAQGEALCRRKLDYQALKGRQIKRLADRALKGRKL